MSEKSPLMQHASVFFISAFINTDNVFDKELQSEIKAKTEKLLHGNYCGLAEYAYDVRMHIYETRCFLVADSNIARSSSSQVI